MRVDLGNALGTDPGVSRAALDELDGDVAEAHGRIDEGRGDGTFGFATLNLPTTTDLDDIRSAVDQVPDASTVLTVGIGGSALGARTLTAALGGEHVALDNVDPAHTRRVLAAVDFDDIAVHVVSRSGTTVETLANFLVVREAMADAGVDWTRRTIVTTGDSGPLRSLAAEHDLPTVPVPIGVPGRFSVLSSMGLVPSAILGHDLNGLMAGAAGAGRPPTRSLVDCSPHR